MSSVQIASITNSHAQSQEALTHKASEDTRLTHQDDITERSPKVSQCEKQSESGFSQPVVLTRDSQTSESQTLRNRSRPTSSRLVSHRAFLTNDLRETHKSLPNQPHSLNITKTDLDLSTPQATDPASNTNAPSNNKRTSSRLSCLSPVSPKHRDIENVSPALHRKPRAVSCDPLLARRSCSSQSKYHEDCFPKEDPALIIGSPYRILSARQRRTKSVHKRPTIRHRESVFTIRESVVNLVYTAHSETEQDELDRARAETARDARALRSGALSNGSFSQGFFHQTNRWAYPAQRNRRAYTHHSDSHHNQLTPQHMAGTLRSSREYPTLQEDDRYTHSRQSFSPHSESDDSTPLPGPQVARPNSEHSLISSGRQTDSPRSDTAQSQRNSGFLYQMVAFDNLADNVPMFVRQNVKKTGRMQTESFILRLNYLRRRRALGETSGTINNSKTKSTPAVAGPSTTVSGGGGTTPRTGHGEGSSFP
ncbi:hypothetical protein RRG08_056857 [Elysia crispata]|uniref:Uncharacterized protein n=1 Tax=Elysia crispata TaxID=231223 RepID=A0AAE1DX92_9GAST|nr:hypothetical protein RRG08_056857 [Elysia crispata]